MPGDEESMSDEAIWETLPVSFIGLTLSNLRQLLFKMLKMLVGSMNMK